MAKQLSSLEETRARIRSVKWKQILLPFLLGVAGILLLTVLAGLAPRTGLTANLLLLVLILCPMFLVLFVFFIALTAAVYGLHRLNELVEKPLRSLEKLSLTVSQKTASVTDTVKAQTVEFSACTAPLEHWMNNAFEPKPRRMETRDVED